MNGFYKTLIEHIKVISVGFMIFLYITHNVTTSFNYIHGDIFNTMYNIGITEDKDDVFQNEINKKLRDTYMQPLRVFKEKKQNEIDEIWIGAALFYVLESS